MQNTLSMLLGAALVALGVLAAALADRIRGLRVSRETAPRERTGRPQAVPAQAVPAQERQDRHERQAIPVVELPRQVLPKTPKVPPKAQDDGGTDVIAALVAAGYKKPIATEATWACSAPERVTVESWTASALRRCARGGLS